MKRDTAATVFRTVVFAGAMLGAPACGKKPAPNTPTNTATPAPAETTPATTTTDPKTTTPDPCAADPCAGMDRPRGTDADGGGGAGRGFVLS
jgi:hypothetical protein